MKDYRRIQKTGESTYILSLPKKWADRNSVSSGTEASIKENEDGSLTVSVKKEVKEASAVIHSTQDVERTLQKIIAAYLAGYQQIAVKGKNAAIVCEEARLKLSGIEILGEKDEEGTLGVLANDKFSIDEILSRMYSISLTLFSLLGRTLEGEKDLDKEASRREQEIDRLYILGLRVINTQSTKLSVGVCKALAIKTIERISDHLAQSYEKQTIKDKQILSLVNELKMLYSEVFENLVNLRNADNTLVKISAFHDKIEKLGKTSAGNTREHLLRISEYLVDLVEITEDLISIRNFFG